jgi:hypothetical protein
MNAEMPATLGTKRKAKASVPPGIVSGCSPPSAKQIDDHHDQRYNQQYVNQASGQMHAKSQQPQNQKYSNNRPKHIDLLCQSLLAFHPSCFASFLSRETELSDFPHSRQTRLARGVISPQNGHTLCSRTSWVRGLNIASNVLRNSRREAIRRRKEGR